MLIRSATQRVMEYFIAAVSVAVLCFAKFNLIELLVANT